MGKKKSTGKPKREFKPEWAHNRPWLIYDAKKKAMFCQICLKAKVINTFTTGCFILKKENVVNHENPKGNRINSHSGAMKLIQSSKDMNEVQIKACSKSKNAVVSAMKNIYFMAKHNLANTMLEDLNELCIDQGATQLKDLKVDGHTSYSHHSSVKDFQKSIATVINETMMHEIKEAKFFSITLDESTDVSVHQNLIIYIRYVKNLGPVTKFFAMSQLQSATAEVITNELLKTFQKYELDVNYFCGVATDGAATMTGKRSGVVTRLKNVYSSVISTHCIAHRLALASANAADSITYLVKFQAILNSIYSYFQNSPKNMNRLENVQLIINEAESCTRFKQVFHTRWLSFGGSVNAIVCNFQALVAVLNEDKSAKAVGLLKSIATYKFLYVAHFLVDILGHLVILCKSFQQADINFSQLSTLLQTTTDIIKNLTSSMAGPVLTKFLSNVNTSESEAIFNGHVLKYSKALQETSVLVCKQFGERIIEKLMIRFENPEDASVLNALCSLFLPPATQGTVRESMTSGEAAQVVCEHYKNSVYFNATSNEVLIEADSLKMFLSKTNLKLSSINDVATYVLSHEELYPTLGLLAKLLLTIPISTVDCERGFSRQNLIKTRIRSRLDITNLENLMKISIEGPDSKLFDFENAFKHWASVPRRILS